MLPVSIGLFRQWSIYAEIPDGASSEGSGEDPFLGSKIAMAMVRGYQGNLTQNNQILACVKHFTLYGASKQVVTTTPQTWAVSDV